MLAGADAERVDTYSRLTLQNTVCVRGKPLGILLGILAGGVYSCAILLVEQNARKALQIADRAYVLETGSITLSGSGAELASSDAVKKAYLGG